MLKYVIILWKKQTQRLIIHMSCIPVISKCKKVVNSLFLYLRNASLYDRNRGKFARVVVRNQEIDPVL